MPRKGRNGNKQTVKAVKDKESPLQGEHQMAKSVKKLSDILKSWADQVEEEEHEERDVVETEVDKDEPDVNGKTDVNGVDVLIKSFMSSLDQNRKMESSEDAEQLRADKRPYKAENSTTLDPTTSTLSKIEESITEIVNRRVEASEKKITDALQNMLERKTSYGNFRCLSEDHCRCCAHWSKKFKSECNEGDRGACDGRSGAYDGRGGAYDGRGGAYDGRSGAYDGRSGAYDGARGAYDGRSGAYDGGRGYRGKKGYWQGKRGPR